MPIRSYLDGNTAFEPDAISAMSQALEEACAALQISADQKSERNVIATRIIDLARSGVIDAKALGDRVIAETKAMRSV